MADADDKLTAALQQLATVSQIRLEGLLQEMTKRTMVVNDDALKHLVERGVLARMAQAGCCKPDGGTCCPNKKVMLESAIEPKSRP